MPKNVAQPIKPNVQRGVNSAKKAPKGVPTLAMWGENRDGSVTGSISNSPNFNDGERITTSPIVTGRIEEGQVVRTGSGSKYFLG